MKYFMPYWEDWVHRDFDPIKDTYGSGGFKNALFAHEIFTPPPYDGILVSLGVFELKLRLIRVNGRPTIRGYKNIKEYLKLPSSFPVLGDCGAFTYVSSKEPQMEVPHAVELYSKLGFDYGISVDHICAETITVKEEDAEKFKFKDVKPVKGGKVKLLLSEEELEGRRQLSLKNAERFLKESMGAPFTPVGAAQGYSVETYVDSVKKLVKMGYRFVALGGLVPRPTEFIGRLLEALYREIDLSGIKVHLLGVLREELLPKMASCGIFSFDSASYFRKAWLKAKENYLGVDRKWYASIRVPDSSNPRLRKRLKGEHSGLKEREEKILKGLRDYDRGSLREVEALVEEVIAYDKLFYREEFKEEKYAELYLSLLKSKIWKECSCPVCRQLGIDVVIFRGSNRNKRRGFHNTKVFYETFVKSR
ncbi:tRNA-guanine transglycosylase DpdA [Thermovibrio sp.]